MPQLKEEVEEKNFENPEFNDSYGNELIHFLSKKWIVKIILAFYDPTNQYFKILRFTHLNDLLQEKSSRTLNIRLNELEKRILIIKKRDSTKARLTQYYLSTKGQELAKELTVLNNWVGQTFQNI